jgi:hypothetical protein
VGSTATTREYGVDKYIVPFATSGVTSLELNPDPPRPRPPALPRSGVAEVAGFMWYTHATSSRLTLAGVICVSGEKRIPPGSCP